MKKLLGGCILMLLTACVSPPLPEDHYYRLEIPPPLRHDLAAHVTVQTLTAAGIYNERPLLYSTAAAPTELRQYHYQYWADMPARMIREQLSAYLRAAQSPRRGAAPAWQVHGVVQRFEQRLGARAATAIVALELIVRRSSDGQPVLRKTYRTEVRAVDSSPLAAAQGLNQALGDCFAQFASDLQNIR